MKKNSQKTDGEKPFHPISQSPILPILGSLLSGILLALAFPGFGNASLVFIGLVPLMFAVQSVSAKKLQRNILPAQLQESAASLLTRLPKKRQRATATVFQSARYRHLFFNAAASITFALSAKGIFGRRKPFINYRKPFVQAIIPRLKSTRN